MAVALGIDLGTTYTVAAIVENGRAQVNPNAEGQRLTPSVVAFTREGRPLVGQVARRQAAANPEATVFSIKRQMGSEHRVRVRGRNYTPAEISSLILAKVKADVEGYLGLPIDKAVITVPAYFNDRQRQATKEAGLLAGLDVIRVINEPTAAALAYGLDREDVHTLLVWDLGGGTFDVSILELGQGIFEVRAVSGDSWLGGDDYDRRLMDYLAEEYRRRYRIEVSPREGGNWQRLREAAEKAKIELSTAPSSQMRVLLTDDHQQRFYPLELTLTRDHFQQLTNDLRQKMIPPTLQALTDAGLRPEDIDRVILVGGATAMPAIRHLALELLGKEPYRHIDPDEVVAKGAAIQSGVLLGTVKKVALLDVLPLSLGIETQGGLFARIISRNTPLPASESRIFTTAADAQDTVDINVLQGERELALYDIPLGHFQLGGVPPLPRGIPKIEVAFDVDVDGIVHISATDLLSESHQGVKIACSKELPLEEAEHLVSEASLSAEEDGRHRERIQAGIEADNVIAAVERVLEAKAGHVPETVSEGLARATMAVKQALACGNAQEIRRRSQELREVVMSWQQLQLG